MSTRIENVPKLRTVPASIDAGLYNTALLTTLRLESPFRIRLTGLKTIDVVINRHTWVCLDRSMYDLPALAWTCINQNNRSALHTPVECELNYYHIHANISAHKVLDNLHSALKEALVSATPNQPGRIITFPR